MKELTTEEKLQQKFEELGRPIWLKELGLTESHINSESDIMRLYFLPKGDFESFYFPRHERLSIIDKLVKKVFIETKKIRSEDLYERIMESISSIYNINAIDPIFLRTDYMINFWSTKGSDIFRKSSETEIKRNLLISWEKFVEALCKKFMDSNVKNDWLEGGVKEYFLTPNRRELLFGEVTKVLHKSDKTFSIEDLVYEIGLTNLPVELKKPITKKELRELVIDNDYFVYNEDDDSVRFLSDEELITKIQKHFAARTVNFDIFDNEINKNGILALVFTGNKAPIEEMKSYINVRPILYLNNLSAAKTKEEIFLLNKEITEDEGNDIKFLKCLFNNNEEYKSWLENNTALSFFEADEILVKHIYAKLVNELSPISNLIHNPGNLLQYTLKLNLQNHLSVNLLKVSEKKND